MATERSESPSAGPPTLLLGLLFCRPRSGSQGATVRREETKTTTPHHRCVKASQSHPKITKMG
jgi:hypothetical protein